MHLTVPRTRRLYLILLRVTARWLAVVALVASLAAPLAAQARRDWMLGPFEKPRAANPVLGVEDGSGFFTSMMRSAATKQSPELKRA